MVNKEFIETFLETISKLANNNMIFVNKLNRGKFTLTENNKELIVKYEEKDLDHIILRRTYSIIDNNTFDHFYYELLMNLFLSITTIGKIKDSYDNNINILSMRDLLETGLDKLKNNNDEPKVWMTHKEYTLWKIELDKMEQELFNIMFYGK